MSHNGMASIKLCCLCSMLSHQSQICFWHPCFKFRSFPGTNLRSDVFCPQSLQDKIVVTRVQWSFLSKFFSQSSGHADILRHYVAIYGVKSEGFVLRVYSLGDRHFPDFIATNFVTAVKKLTFLQSSYERSQM